MFLKVNGKGGAAQFSKVEHHPKTQNWREISFGPTFGHFFESLIYGMMWQFRGWKRAISGLETQKHHETLSNRSFLASDIARPILECKHGSIIQWLNRKKTPQNRTLQHKEKAHVYMCICIYTVACSIAAAIFAVLPRLKQKMAK